MDDNLGEQRVEVRARRVAYVAGGLVAHAGTGGEVEGGQCSTLRPHPTVGVEGLHVDPHLDCEAARGGSATEPQLGERRAVGEPQLGGNQIDACGFLGDRMLDLQARVGFDEVELAAVGVDQELEGPEAAVVECQRHPARCLAQSAADFAVEMGRRRDFQDLLVAPLQRAVALAERRDRAAVVAGDLHLDVTRSDQFLLGVEIAAAERFLGFRTAALHRRPDFLDPTDCPHAAPAAAADGFDDHRRTSRQALE